MNKRRYNYKKGTPRLSVNKTNLKVLDQSKPVPQGQVIEISRPGKEASHILRPWGKQKTEWQEQFKAKQDVKAFYGGISEKELLKLSREAARQNKPLIDLIEQRLEVLVFRLQWARSVYEARQKIRHALIRVNGKLSSQPKELIEPGSTLEITQYPYESVFTRLTNVHFQEIPSYLLEKEGTAFLLRTPTEKEIKLPFSITSGKLKAYCSYRD